MPQHARSESVPRTEIQEFAEPRLGTKRGLFVEPVRHFEVSLDVGRVHHITARSCFLIDSPELRCLGVNLSEITRKFGTKEKFGLRDDVGQIGRTPSEWTIRTAS